MKLYTSQETFESLHRNADSKARAVRVDRAALLHLLMDHSTMLAALERIGFAPDSAKAAARNPFQD